MTSLRAKEGYLEVDHRASPGLPEEVARAAGYDPRHCVGGKVFEAATITCSHCGCAFVRNPLRVRPREYCRRCDHYICDPCHVVRSKPGYVHFPYLKYRDLLLNLAVKEAPLGSPQELMQSVGPTIIVP